MDMTDLQASGGTLGPYNADGSYQRCVDANLRNAAADAVKACVPVLPIVGGKRMGYRVSSAGHRLWSRAEVEKAAAAVCELYRVLRELEG